MKEWILIAIVTGLVFTIGAQWRYMTVSQNIEQFADKCLPVDEGQRAVILIVDGKYECHLQPV